MNTAYGEHRNTQGQIENLAEFLNKDVAQPEVSWVDAGIYGVVGDGVTDDTSNLLDAIAAADAEQKPLFLDGKHVRITQDIDLPRYGLYGDGQIRGGKCRVYRVRDTFHQRGGRMQFDDFHVSGCQYGTFEWIDAGTGGDGILIDGGSEAGDQGYGVFWCQFIRSRGSLRIDTSKHSVNQNTFHHHRGGLHIYGGAGSTHPNECNQNKWIAIDTTNSAIGAGQWAILNEAENNQTNMIETWYSEAAGTRAISGNFHVVSSYVDTSRSPYALDLTNHVSHTPDNSVRNRSDYFAGLPYNHCVGGLWDVLDMDSLGEPMAYTTFGGLTPTVVQDLNDPTGIGWKYGGTTSSSFSGILINLEGFSNGWYSTYVVLQGDTPANISFLRNNDEVSCGVDVFKEYPNGYKVYRISSQASNDLSPTGLKIYFNTSGTSSKTTFVAGCWASPTKTAFVPWAVPGHQKIGLSTGGTPLDHATLPIGGRIFTDAQGTDYGVYEWVKTPDGIKPTGSDLYTDELAVFEGSDLDGTSTNLFNITETVFSAGAGFKLSLTVNKSGGTGRFAGSQEYVVGLYANGDTSSHHALVTQLGSAIVSSTGLEETGVSLVVSPGAGNSYDVSVTHPAGSNSIFIRAKLEMFGSGFAVTSY